MQVDDDVLDAIQEAYQRLGSDLRKINRAVLMINMLHALDPECVEEVFHQRAGKSLGRGPKTYGPLPPDEMYETEMAP